MPVVGVDHAPTTVFDTEADAPVPVLKQLQVGSASGRGLETSPTVSDHAVRLSLLIIGHLAHVFAHPQSIIALVT